MQDNNTVTTPAPSPLINDVNFINLLIKDADFNYPTVADCIAIIEKDRLMVYVVINYGNLPMNTQYRIHNSYSLIIMENGMKIFLIKEIFTILFKLLVILLIKLTSMILSFILLLLIPNSILQLQSQHEFFILLLKRNILVFVLMLLHTKQLLKW